MPTTIIHVRYDAYNCILHFKIQICTDQWNYVHYLFDLTKGCFLFEKNSNIVIFPLKSYSTTNS